jgi:prepilin-type processing-associated H-X9-DG protein
MGINQALIFDFNGSSPVYYRYIGASQIEFPANTVFVADGGTDGRIAPPHFLQGYYEKFVTNVPYTRDAPWRHAEGANYTWCDGHSKYAKGDKLFPSPTPKGTWPAPTSVLGRARCATANYFAPQTAEKQYLRNLAQSSYGVSCSVEE